MTYFPKQYQLSGFNVVGHSYTDYVYNSAYAPVSDQETMISRFAGIVGASPSNIIHLGQFGSSISSPVGYLSGPDAGWLGVLKYIHPKNDDQVVPGLVLQTDRLAASIAPTIIIHGINDVNGNAASSPTQGVNAVCHAYLTTITRARAAVLFGSRTTGGGAATASWDATIAASGFTSTTGTQYTGPATYNSSTNGNTLTFTVPTLFTGATAFFTFIAPQSGMTTLNGGINNSVTSITVTSSSLFPASGTIVIQIDSEQMLVTAGLGTTTWTVTRGVNGTSAAAHLTGANVTTAQTFGVTWTTNGSNATITGTTTLAGQGYNGQPVALTQRFALTSADAGKTITATVSGIVTSDTSAAVLFDSWGLEAPEPAHVILSNIVAVNNSTYGGNGVAIIATYNTAIAAVVAQFDQYVKIIDFNGAIQNQSCVLAASMTNAQTTIAVTANSTSFPTNPGFRITTCNGTNAGEDMLVTGISGTYPNYTLTVTRAYNSTSATTHNNGDTATTCSWLHTDDLHPNLYGSGAFAQLIYNAFSTVPTSYYQQGLMGQSYSKNIGLAVTGNVNNTQCYPAGATVTTGVITLNTQYAFPILIRFPAIITALGIQVTSGITSSTIRLGIYANNPERARPGSCLLDVGTVAATAAAQESITGISLVVYPGIYWLSACAQGGASGPTVATFGGSVLNVDVGQMTGNTTSASGFSQTGITGAFSAFASYTGVSTGMPYMWYKVSTPHNVFV